MAVTMTFDKVFRGRNNLTGAGAAGVKIHFGTIAMPTYAGSGVTWTFPNFGTTQYVQVQPASGYIFEYDYTNTLLKVLYPTASVTVTGTSENDASPAQEIASDTSLASWSALRFFAIGTGKL